MTQRAAGTKDVTAAEVVKRKNDQGSAAPGSPDADPFVVLLYRNHGALAVSPDQRANLADRLHAEAAIHEFQLLANPDADAFKTLEVEPSTPKLLLYWNGELKLPVWLLDPEEPNLAGWIEALRERDGFPPLTP